ncbi:MAG: peptidoglycan DD-metalloendopeptidase family protein [Pseudomonadota bacterium]|nr:peptidoglycan DD-metalloendopeptidase family protein [Pseudomonadota bacterium]
MALKFSTALLFAASAAALAACGSSRNSAPIVYGTNPAAPGRIYNSPTESRAPAPLYAQSSQAPAYQAPSYQPPRQASAGAQPARLTPVTAETLQPAPQPTYVSSYETVKSPPSGALLVTVRPGDTVYAISRRTGASPQAIIAENRLRPPYTLNVGETLRIPDPSAKIVNELTQSAPQPTYASAPQAGVRVVRPGDTLYSISRATGAPVPAIAQANNLRAPYTLSVGQQLVIPGAQGGVTTPVPRQREASADVGDLARTVSYTKPVPSSSGKMFDWPVKGAIIAEFGSAGVGRRNDGVNIAAPVGTPVRAAADGEVVYRGSELDGYGNLLLVKHADGFVTAYAHNDSMAVRKGEKVRKGQIIAKVGQTGAVTEPQLHFEIRQNLKSVDPLALLQ